MTGLPQGDAPYLLDTSYTIPSDFNKLTIMIDRLQLSPEEIKKLEEGWKRVEAGRE